MPLAWCDDTNLWNMEYYIFHIMEFLGLSLYLWKLWIQEKKGFIPENSTKLWYMHSFFGLEISTRPKTKTHGNSTWFFLDQLTTPRNSTSFLINPWNFLMLFHFFNIPTPGICMSLTPSPPCPLPPVFEFFWNSMHNIAKKQQTKSLQSR